MTTLRANGLAKSYGIHTLFENVSFTVSTGEVVGFVGANGAGKTTFLRCLLGIEEFDSGTVTYDGPVTIGYVEQQAELHGPTIYDDFLVAFADIRRLEDKKAELEARLHHHGSDTVKYEDNLTEEELLAEYERILLRFEQLSGYDYEARIRKVAFGLGFSDADFSRRTDELSGGQKTRVLLARALLREPDFLYLDEPTNHLDIEMIEWLEAYLKNYRGAVLIISHDRAFLDSVSAKTIELANKTTTTYAGGYSYYVKVRDERRAALEAAYAKQQEHIKATEEYIRKYKAGIKSKQARGRQSQLDRLERIILPPEARTFDFFSFQPPAECAERVFESENLSFGYNPQHLLLKNLSLLIKKGEGVALIGANGIGKTTLLKLIVGELTATDGRFKIGNRVKIGYFSQEHENLNPTRTVFQEIQDDFGFDDFTCRKYLGAFLFHGDEVEKIVGELSGGEAARLSFLKLMLTGANFLILDEPTNHLDIPAKEAIENALMSFPGTFLVVSHDRYFLNQVTNRTLEFADGIITPYEGPYDYYREKKAALAAWHDENAAPPNPDTLKNAETKISSHRTPPKMLGGEPSPQPDNKKTASPKEDGGKSKPTAPAKVSDQPKAAAKPPVDEEKLARAEAEIAMCEAELKMLEREISDPANQSDPVRSAELAAEYAAKEEELLQRYEKWGNMV
ncbi:MAG: ATP-binding cassette domain-containing protein [Selenomonadaceae bacterium]|nr:ATP-binding cassette domain-containing protein [Selenomonadaceae bacterium]